MEVVEAGREERGDIEVTGGCSGVVMVYHITASICSDSTAQHHVM